MADTRRRRSAGPWATRLAALVRPGDFLMVQGERGPVPRLVRRVTTDDTGHVLIRCWQDTADATITLPADLCVAVA